MVMPKKRQDYIFRSSPVTIRDAEDGDLRLPCICFYERQSGILVDVPFFERWYIDFNKKPPAAMTLRKRSYHITSLLNYVLWETTLNGIHEIDRCILREYAKASRFGADGLSRSPEDWRRRLGDVIYFISRYHQCNKDLLTFHYTSEELYTEEIQLDKRRRKRVVLVPNTFFVTPPRASPKKNRSFPEGYLPLLLFEAQVYDPMLVLPISLQAYGGLREGEVVNLTCGRIKIQSGAFDTISDITLDLMRPAPFVTSPNFGHIKVFRMQKIYTDFRKEAAKAIREHLARQTARGIPTGPQDPLLVNKFGHPMSVETYTDRVRDLFYDHFVPDLSRLSEKAGTWETHSVFLDAYEDEYPGAHALRGWFTMYLVEHAKLPNSIVAKWRGDRNVHSLEDYLHINAEMRELFTKSAYMFQEWFIREVL